MRHVTITRFANPQRVILPGDNRYSTPLYSVVDDDGRPVEGMVTSIGISSESGLLHRIKTGEPTRVWLCFEDGRSEDVMATYIDERKNTNNA